MLLNLRRLLIGSPLPSAEAIHERLGKVQALAVLSSDALSSVAYGTEEILLTLVLAGTGALSVSLPIGLAIAALMIIVAASYYQTVHAYPSGGGAYTVARENLGIYAGLVAGAALLNDYLLTVAVSVSAGVAAITAAVPALYPWRVPMALGAVLFVTLVNLRGIRESGRVFAIPTYLFIGTMYLLIITGLGRLLLGMPPASPIATEATTQAVQDLTLFLILRAFSSGCSALTGVEAISNGVPIFRPPESHNAGKTLLWMAGILTSMFIGITLLANAYRIVPIEGETVISQLARATWGQGFLYYTVQAATAMILILAANTSFADFPRLSMWMARDRYLPRQLANVGDRLVFNNGILLLGALAAGLIIIFRASTHALIPLYAVGVFTSFTLSQSGMVRRWLRLRTEGWLHSAIINGLGACATFVVLIVVAATKFVHGAWLVLILIPLLVYGFTRIQRHYVQLSEELSLDRRWPTPARRHTMVVPVSGLHRGVVKAVQYAQTLCGDLHAVTVDIDAAETEALIEYWNRMLPDVPLEVLPSPYRSVTGPLLQYIESLVEQEGDYVTVVMPEFVPNRWWHGLLHNKSANLLRNALLSDRQSWRGRFRIITDVPFYVGR
ncbi:MAG: APC family permease [Anaerolineae bacterium]